jgi:hypothetical protein
MTPHRLTANEKVTELETPIASAAILPSALLLGVLVTGPSRLALVPLGGGSAHVVDLHLDSPQEVALLSPDAALVRTADGAVWALADLAGEPRPKVIAREIRSLHARPGGAHALGIGTDGSATAFSIARGELSARTFTARGGALRAADVDEHVTYVIAEGEEGGAFRIHPGATPELGTSARTTLPREAAGLDRVRGGASLAVVFKRGEASVAVITGGPRRFDAKLVHLGGKVADAAVIGSSLAVVFIDGRAALYDEAAIARGGAASMEPVSELALGTRGRPRVLLASSIKGAPVLCVGTSSGELVSLAVGFAEASAPEPPREAPEVIEAPKAAPIEAETPAIEAVTAPEVIAFESLASEAAPPLEPAAAEEAPAPFAPSAPVFTARIAELEAELDTLRQALATVEAAGARERLDAADDRARILAEAAAGREKDRSDAAEDKARALAEAAERAARELAATVRAEREAGELSLSDRGRALEASKELAIRALQEEHTAALARAEQSHEKALASRDEATAALKQRLEEEQQALSAELDATAKRLGVEIDRAIAGEAELEARTRHLASEHAEVDDLRAEVERLREETARQRVEIAEQKAEIEKLDDAVSRERDRAIAAERAGEGVINVDRAREKLSSVLDRVRSELEKRR